MSEKKGKYRIGFDLGGTKMMAVLLDGEYNIIGKEKRKTKGYLGKEEGIKRVFKTINNLIDDSKIDRADLCGIGLASPGPMSLKDGVILNPPNIGWGNLKIKKLLEKEYKIPLALCNDVDAGVYGEYCFGAGKGSESLLGIFPGTGIGGGYVYCGELMQGKDSPIMELGHIIVNPNGSRCGCGNRGCLETEASKLAVASKIALEAYRGNAPWIFDKCGLDISKMGSSKIASSIKNGDKVVGKIVKDAAKWLGIGAVNVVNLLNPDSIVLGGGMVEAMPDIFLKHVKKSLDKMIYPGYQGKHEIKVAEKGDYSNVLGAAAILDELLKNN